MPEEPRDESVCRYTVRKYGSRNFAVYEGEELVVVTVYKKGAREVRRRLEEALDARNTVQGAQP